MPQDFQARFLGGSYDWRIRNPAHPLRQQVFRPFTIYEQAVPLPQPASSSNTNDLCTPLNTTQMMLYETIINKYFFNSVIKGLDLSVENQPVMEAYTTGEISEGSTPCQ